LTLQNKTMSNRKQNENIKSELEMKESSFNEEKDSDHNQPYPYLTAPTYEVSEEGNSSHNDDCDDDSLYEFPIPKPDELATSLKPLTDIERGVSALSTTTIAKEQQEPVQPLNQSFVYRVIDSFKYIYSFILLLFCVTMVMACIFTSQSTAVSYNIHPVGAFFLFWFLVGWLALIEGGQGCIVGLQPVDKAKYADSHMVSHMVTELAHRGDNLERFIIGRQFLVVLVIFLINICGSATKGADPLGLPKLWNDIFLENGVAMIMTVIVIGQLTSQVNAAVCLLDFINNYLMLFTTHLSLWIECSGLLHCVYLVQILFSKLSGTTMETEEPRRSMISRVFFWTRVMGSTALLGFCLAVTLQALFDGNSGMWEGVPTWASVVIFITFLCLVGLMDGMQIAAFALMNVPDEELHQHSVAYTNCQLMFSGQNLQSFLIGRQVFVASLMFIVARIASINGPEGYVIFGVPGAVQGFFNTGLLGSVVLTIVGSLVWRIVASSYPLAFMSNPMVYIVIRMCLIVEGSGLCKASWGIAHFHKYFCDMKPDEIYLLSEDTLHEHDGNSV
jgi:hypothetical protein